MVTKGYGFTVEDIDWSSPSDLEPYGKAHKLEITEKDSIFHAVCGSYVLSAVSVAIEHCLSGQKAKSEYIKEPIMKNAFDDDTLTEEENYERNLKKALLAEEQWIIVGKQKGLPKTII